MLKKYLCFILSVLFVATWLCACSDGKKEKEEEGGIKYAWEMTDENTSHINSSNKLIAFTFDDGLQSNTVDLLNAFDTFNQQNPTFKATATMFMLGGQINDSDSEIMTRIVAMNMEFGNHSYSHPRLTQFSNENILKEIDDTDAILKKYDGKDKHLFRPPYLDYTQDMLNLINTPAIFCTWVLDTTDWSGVSAESIYNTVIDNKCEGGIVLMHQGYNTTIQAVERLLPKLKEAGYQVVSVSQLAKVRNKTLQKASIYTQI